MQQTKLDLANLQWQLELLVELDPPIIGLALQDLGTFLSATDPPEQAADILIHFIRAGFTGLGTFLKTVELGFKENGPLPTVVGEILRSWNALTSLSDAELVKAADTSNIIALSPEDKMVEITGSQGREGLARLFNPFDLYQFGQMGATNPESDFYHKRVATELARSGPYKKYTFELDALEKLCELPSIAPNFTVVTECVIDAV
ncbi:MAG: hypothetical protein M1305_04170, partial [Candidatus Marsarchaeota archaeon]|nr:hypothetical protein [Candidatus Marsarchaeota archaeon]